MRKVFFFKLGFCTFFFLSLFLFAEIVCGQSKSSSVKKQDKETFALSLMEQALINEINTVRTNPKVYIKYLEDYRKYFKGNILTLPSETPLITAEGVKPVDEAIDALKKLEMVEAALTDLKNAKKTNTLNVSEGLTKAARDHLKDMIANSFFGHRGSNKSTPEQRIIRYVFTSNNGIRENLSFGGKTAKDIVMMMLVDDGVESRGHRKNILDKMLKNIGVAVGTNKDNYLLSVIDFSAELTEKKDFFLKSKPTKF